MQPPWVSTCSSMLSRTSAILLIFLGSAGAATTPDLWPAQTQPLDTAALKTQLATLDAASRGLSASLLPAVQFQKVFVQMISGVPPAAWRVELERLAMLAGNDVVSQNVRELARVWLARVEMQELEPVLRKYYRMHVQFPDTLAQVEKDIPENLRRDPWGEPWVYKLRAPQGFTRQTTQRYQLGPARFQQLTTFREATTARQPRPHPWKISPRDIGGNKALEFRNTSVAILQAGGTVGDCVLLFIGERWVLMAELDQLVALAF